MLLHAAFLSPRNHTHTHTTGPHLSHLCAGNHSFPVKGHPCEKLIPLKVLTLSKSNSSIHSTSNHFSLIMLTQITLIALTLASAAAINLGKGTHANPGDFDLYVFATR